MSSSYKVEEIPGAQLNLGEAPHWDAKRQSLYYVSLFEATIHRLDYGENKVYSAAVEGCTCTSFIVPVKGRSSEFVVGDGTRLVLISWDGVSAKATKVKVLADLAEQESGNRWNDGKVDSKGRLYAGTMTLQTNCFEINTGSFYRYEATRTSFVKLFGDVFISNGLAWNDKAKKFYYVDSAEYEVKEFDVDKNGNLSNGKVLYDFKENGVKPVHFPDGMTIDEKGNLYVAVFHGSKVLKINPKGQVEQEILIPAKQVTSVAFGGPNLDELYVTTAQKQVLEPQLPPAGATFKVTGLGVRGTPMYEMEL